MGNSSQTFISKHKKNCSQILFLHRHSELLASLQKKNMFTTFFFIQCVKPCENFFFIFFFQESRTKKIFFVHRHSELLASLQKKNLRKNFLFFFSNTTQHVATFFCRHSTCCNIFFSSQSTCCNMLQLFFQTLHITSNFFSHRHILTQPCWVKMQSDCMSVKTCRYDFESFWRTQRVS